MISQAPNLLNISVIQASVFVDDGMGELKKDISNHVAMHVCQTSFDTVVIKAESFVIQPHEVKQCGVKVMGGRNIFDCLVTEWIGGTVTERGLNTCSSQESCEATRIVIPAASSFLEGWHAPEFSAPNDQGMVQKASLPQILYECGSGLIHDLSVNLVLLLEGFVAIPITHSFSSGLIGSIEELHKTHTLLDQSPCKDAVTSVSAFEVRGARISTRAIHTIGLQDMPGFTA
jgi:hypothetical protein